MELVVLRRGTKYPKNVQAAPASPVNQMTGLRVLKQVKGNAKLGKGANRVTRGRWRGMRLWTLTLEERATCPSTCDRWHDCFGNRMPFAVRYSAGPALEEAIAHDVAALAKRSPEGFIVRTHVLGDFYSVDYVESWATLLALHPTLHLYGYTHREYGTPIGDAVASLVARFPEQVSILRSNGLGSTDPLPPAQVVSAGSAAPHPATKVICPEQTGATASCLTCGLCMNGKTSVSFLNHGVRDLTLTTKAA